jgi:hypothetical protein
MLLPLIGDKTIAKKAKATLRFSMTRKPFL